MKEWIYADGTVHTRVTAQTLPHTQLATSITDADVGCARVRG